MKNGSKYRNILGDWIHKKIGLAELDSLFSKLDSEDEKVLEEKKKELIVFGSFSNFSFVEESQQYGTFINQVLSICRSEKLSEEQIQNQLEIIHR